MVNQWGRDGNFSSSGNGGSRSAAGILIPAVVALLIGAGGGYGSARFFSGVSASDVAARDKKIAELNNTLSEMKFDTQGSNTQQEVLRQRVKDLEAQVGALTRTKESLKDYADKQASKASDDAEAEIAALKKTIEEAGDLSGQLTRAKRSARVAELQIIELEKAVSDQKTVIAKLNATIEKSKDKANPAIVLLQGQKDLLESQLAEANKRAADIPALKSRIATLQDQLAKRSDDADAAAKQQIAVLERQRDILQRQLDNAVKSSGDADAQARRVAQLQKQLDDLAESVADRDAAARDAAQQLKQAKADLDKTQKQIKTLRDQNKTLTDAQQGLNKQIAALNATIANLKKAAADKQDTSDKPDSADDEQNDTNPDTASLTPRDRDAVEKAVEDLPGYANLNANRQRALVDMLERGECVTDSLKSAYGHVSPIALRSLFRQLGGRC